MPSGYHSRNPHNNRRGKGNLRPLLTITELQQRVQARQNLAPHRVGHPAAGNGVARPDGTPDGSVNTSTTTPSEFSLRNKTGKILDQGQLSSCTAHAAVEGRDLLRRHLDPPLSRLYVYAGERRRETSAGQPLKDTGADPVDALAYMTSNGICEESLWPYDPSQVDVDPPANLAANAAKYKITQSQRLNCPDILATKTMLLRGIPVMLAIAVYQSFMSAVVAQTGQISMPGCRTYWDPHDSIDPCVGGHEVLCIGYSDTTQTLTCQNSWGPSWGDNGFFYLPYAYANNSELIVSQCCIIQV